jgi:23S rRNA (cytidine1920-2'-O)/16S rRNA (cytidine1409-2'-O)-methyltransferase
VTVRGIPTPKPASLVSPETPIELVSDERRWVSRGAPKLLAALEVFPIEVAGKRALDVGASTGGFTEVLLDAGAAHVVALDVGRAQLHEMLREHPRVTSLERTNFRESTSSQLGRFPLVVADVSFISLCTLAARFAEMGEEGTDYMLLVKPQFEAQRRDVGKGGVVRDPSVRRQAVLKVAECVGEVGLGALGVIESPVKGLDGNVEYLLWLRKGSESRDLEVPS